jgi:hypothetical protein
MRVQASSAIPAIAARARVFMAMARENLAPVAVIAATVFALQYAESARTRIGPVAPARRDVATASRISARCPQNPA